MGEATRIFCLIAVHKKTQQSKKEQKEAKAKAKKAQEAETTGAVEESGTHDTEAAATEGDTNKENGLRQETIDWYETVQL